MKIVSLILKLFIIIATLAYSGISIFVGYLFFSSTGLFGTPNTSMKQFSGEIMLTLSFAMVVVSVFVFRKKSIRYLIALLISSTIIYIAFVFIDGFGNEFDLFFILYIILLISLYWINRFTEKRQDKVSKK
jgi:hypothetical protein